MACPGADCESATCDWEMMPDAHLHVRAEASSWSSERQLFIFPQSKVLWALPPLDERHLPPPFGDEKEVFLRNISPHYVLSTDKTACPPRKYKTVLGKAYVKRMSSGLGVWEESLYPALAPKPHVAAEAYARLVVRHFWTYWEDPPHIHMCLFAKEQRDHGFFSFDAMDPLTRALVTAETGDKEYRQVIKELVERWGERRTVEAVTMGDALDKMFP